MMKSRNLILIALVVLAIGLAVAQRRGKKKKNQDANHDSHHGTGGNNNGTCKVKVMDDCGATVFVFGKRNVYLPVNEQEMVPHCAEEFEAETCIKNYARRCLPPFARQLVGILLLGASQVIKQRCTPQGTREYLSHRTCIKNTITRLHDCMDQLVSSLDAISSAPADDRIPMACCAFGRYTHCSRQPIRESCLADDPTAEEYIAVKMIKGYASEVLDLACQGYEWGHEKCNEVKIPDGALALREGKLIQVDNSTKFKKSASLLPPFINIFTKL